MERETEILVLGGTCIELIPKLNPLKKKRKRKENKETVCAAQVIGLLHYAN